MKGFVIRALGATTMVALAGAQELPTPFFQLATGDPGPFGNPLEQVNDIAINRRGDLYWNAYDLVLDQQYTALNGVIQSMSGDALGNSGYVAIPPAQSIEVAPGGRPWSRVAGISITDPGDTQFFAVTGSKVVIAPGQTCHAPSLPVGSTYEVIISVSSAGETSCQAFVDLSVGGLTMKGVVRVTVDGAGDIVNEEVLILEGLPAPGFQGPVQTLFGAYYAGPNASVARGFAPLLTLVFNGNVVIRPGDPSPYPGLTWDALRSSAIGSNGDWALEGLLSNGKRVIVKNGQPFMHEDELPAILLNSQNPVRRMVPVHISSRGRLVWRVEQSLTNPSANAASYFVERKPMAQSWRVQFGGEPITFGTSSTRIDPDGVHLCFAGGPVNSPGFFNFVAATYLDQADPVCSNGGASTGETPLVSVHGSPWLADGTDFELMTRRLPPQTFALTLVSSTPVPGSSVTGAIGDLCLGGPIFRSPVLRSNGLGTTRAWLSDVPIPPSLEPAVGETWRFQTWYRDVDAATGATVSRFTEAVEMPFL